jgi:hypothetical protein
VQLVHEINDYLLRLRAGIVIPLGAQATSDADTTRASLLVPVLRHAQAVATANQPLTGALPTIDGYSVQDGDRVLLTAQTTASQNGPWIARNSGWTRPDDFPTGAVLTSRSMKVTGGTVYGGTDWVLKSTAPVTVDTTAQTWAQTAGAAVASHPDVQVFSTAGTATWTKPTGATVVEVLCVQPGGGGGAGATAATSTIRQGGGGGAGGIASSRTYRASTLSSTETVVVGAGGAGGAANSGTSANGANGADGGHTYFKSAEFSGVSTTTGHQGGTGGNSAAPAANAAAASTVPADGNVGGAAGGGSVTGGNGGTGLAGFQGNPVGGGRGGGPSATTKAATAAAAALQARPRAATPGPAARVSTAAAAAAAAPPRMARPRAPAARAATAS